MMFKKFYTVAILFQIFCIQLTLAKEPVCSKFSYEEQLLEKMIRTEIKVETMANEMKVIQESVMDTLGVITKTVKDFTERFEELRKNNTEELLEGSEIIENKIEVLEKLIQATHVNVSHEIENQRADFDVLQGKLERSAVGFHVHHVTDLNLDSSKVIIFDSIITNEGSGYDTSTGIFTAPIGGLYQFSVHTCTFSSHHSYIGIVHADKAISKKYGYGSSGSFTCSSVEGIIRVKSGERVWVKSLDGGSSYKLYQDANMMATFSGVLINS